MSNNMPSTEAFENLKEVLSHCKNSQEMCEIHAIFVLYRIAKEKYKKGEK